MSRDATCRITGTMTRDPELKFTPSGMAVAQIGIAVNERVKGDDGKWGDGDASFFNVSIWGQMAENVAESLAKGHRVVVVGSMKMDYWEKDGEKKSGLKITADSIGPDLRFATAEVVKPERQERSQSNPSQEDPFGRG